MVMMARVRSLLRDYIGSRTIKSDGNGTGSWPKFGSRRRRTPFDGEIVRRQRVARRLHHHGLLNVSDAADRAGMIGRLLVGPVAGRLLLDSVGFVGLVRLVRLLRLLGLVRLVGDDAVDLARALGRALTD